MQGNIVFVDYDLSSWRHMNDDLYVPSNTRNIFAVKNRGQQIVIVSLKQVMLYVMMFLQKAWEAPMAVSGSRVQTNRRMNVFWGSQEK